MSHKITVVEQKPNALKLKNLAPKIYAKINDCVYITIKDGPEIEGLGKGVAINLATGFILGDEGATANEYAEIIPTGSKINIDVNYDS